MIDTTVLEAAESHGEAFAVVLTEDEAARLIERILEAHKRVAARKAEAEAWVSEAVKRAESLEAWALPQLEKFYDAHPPRKGRTLTTKGGKLARRTVPGGPRVVDRGAVVEWAQREGVKSVLICEEVYKVDAGAVREYIEGSGEVPPGVVIVPDSETFSVKPSKSEE